MCWLWILSKSSHIWYTDKRLGETNCARRNILLSILSCCLTLEVFYDTYPSHSLKAFKSSFYDSCWIQGLGNCGWTALTLLGQLGDVCCDLPISNKGDAKECNNNRSVALTSHASKVMLKELKGEKKPLSLYGMRDARCSS